MSPAAKKKSPAEATKGAGPPAGRAQVLAKTMTQDEAKREVIRLYNTEFLAQAGGLESRSDASGAVEFYGWLTQIIPKFLLFPSLVLIATRS